MKKTTRKLSLSTSTVRLLSDFQMGRVQGGAEMYPITPNCPQDGSTTYWEGGCTGDMSRMTYCPTRTR